MTAATLPGLDGYRRFICGPAEDATETSVAHYGWHTRRGTKPCGRSKAEAARYRAEYNAGRSLPGYRYRPRRAEYQCGTADDYIPVNPGTGHYEHHRRNGTEPCGKSKRELSHYVTQRKQGRELPGWEPRKAEAYVCGTGEAEVKAGNGHRNWHQRNGTEPCGAAKAAATLYQAERRNRVADIPPGATEGRKPTWLYTINFGNGTFYYGITAYLRRRLLEHYAADTEVGRRLRAGMIYNFRPLYRLPNRYWAVRMETGIVRNLSEYPQMLNKTGRNVP